MAQHAAESDAWIEYLDADVCRRLLASHPVGRVAVLVDGAPEIFPVNHALIDGSVVFRTDDGTKLQALLADPRTCFETDGLDLERRTGWSVLVKGVAREITSAAELARVERLTFEYWGIGPKAHLVAIDATEISGRAIRRPEIDLPPHAWTPDGPA
jgi:nitroimidazol reductase NimA-like FMN-containing flavoprotein (pyridoxamine 5'-phosphate oxidase superfamily)